MNTDNEILQKILEIEKEFKLYKETEALIEEVAFVGASNIEKKTWAHALFLGLKFPEEIDKYYDPYYLRFPIYRNSVKYNLLGSHNIRMTFEILSRGRNKDLEFLGSIVDKFDFSNMVEYLENWVSWASIDFIPVLLVAIEKMSMTSQVTILSLLAKNSTNLVNSAVKYIPEIWDAVEKAEANGGCRQALASAKQNMANLLQEQHDALEEKAAFCDDSIVRYNVAKKCRKIKLLNQMRYDDDVRVADMAQKNLEFWELQIQRKKPKLRH